MDKRTKIVIFLISTILSVAMTLLSYFGWIRYVTIYRRPLEKYIEEYNAPRKTKEKNRIIVSLTTTPDKVKKLSLVLKSLLDQTTRVDQIALNIPPDHKGHKYIIPEEYKKVVNVFKIGKDCGYVNGILPTIKREGECGTIIIVVNDDKIYGKDFILAANN